MGFRFARQQNRSHKIEKLMCLAVYLRPKGKTQKEHSFQVPEGFLKPWEPAMINHRKHDIEGKI